MPDRDVATTRNLIYCQNATIIAKSAFAASDEKSRMKEMLAGSQDLIE